MLRQAPAPFELVLDISAIAEREIEVRPLGLGAAIPPFCVAPICGVAGQRPLLVPDEVKPAEAQHAAFQKTEELGDRYYAMLFAQRPALQEWLNARIEAGGGRLVIVSDSPVVFLERFETLRTPDKKPFALQGISVVRQLATATATAAASRIPPGQALRVLFVAPQHVPGMPNGAAELRHRLGDDAVVECQPPTLEQLLRLIVTERKRGRPFQVVHVNGQGFFEFGSPPGHGALRFLDPKGGAPSVDSRLLTEACGGLPLMVLEAHKIGTRSLEQAFADAVPHLLRHGIQAAVTIPDFLPSDHVAAFLSRFYDALQDGKSPGYAVMAGGRELEVLAASERGGRPGQGSSAGRRSSVSIQHYQQGPDAPLVLAPSAPAVLDAAPSTPSASSLAPLVSSPGAVAPALSTRVSRRTLGWAALGFTAIVVSGFIARHIHTQRQQQAHAVAVSRHRAEIAAERVRIEAEVSSCLNPNPYHCTLALKRAEQCAAQKSELWPDCNYWIGRIKEDGLAGQRDLPGALAAYGRACDADHPLGCLNLGYMKEHGRGLPHPVPLEARMDYERGCSLDNREACANAALLFATEDPARGLHANPIRAQALYHKACPINSTTGIPSGCVGLGTLMLEQFGDDQGAYRLFSTACAQDNLHGCTRQGDLTTVPAEREHLYRKACESLDLRHGACSGCIPLARHYVETPGKEQAAMALFDELCHTGCEASDSPVRSCCQDTEVRGAACRWLGWVWQFGKLKRPSDLAQARKAFQQGCASGNKLSCKYLRALPEGR